MKCIALRDFIQGFGNPLKLPDGDAHVKMGTIVCIGDEFAPADQLEEEDQQLYKKFLDAACLCPLDSNRGQHLVEELERLRELELEVTEVEKRLHPDTRWWQRPKGITILSVMGVSAVFIIAMMVMHFVSR